MRLIIHRPDDWLHIDYFMNPIPAAAIAGMALNDHVLKYRFPSWLTGKLSDFLGMFYFPLFLCALICVTANYLLQWPKRKDRIAYINGPLMWVAMAASATGLGWIKLSPDGARLAEQWASSVFVTTRITSDPTDLMALVMLPLSYLYARRFFNSPPRAPQW